MIKPEVRIIAWDDFAFDFDDESVTVVGAVFRGGRFLDGLVSTRITKDGADATEKIGAVVKNTRHFDQLSYIMLDGITFAGFNMVDIAKLNNYTGLPVIVIIRKKPDIQGFVRAMKSLPGYESRLVAMSNAGSIYTYKNIFYQKSGLDEKECEELLDATCTNSNIPEPLRCVHLIASGLSRKSGEMFESRGRA